MPGHGGLYSNEKADKLARGGSITPFVGPGPVSEVSSSFAITAILKKVALQSLDK